MDDSELQEKAAFVEQKYKEINEGADGDKLPAWNRKVAKMTEHVRGD